MGRFHHSCAVLQANDGAMWPKLLEAALYPIDTLTTALVATRKLRSAVWRPATGTPSKRYGHPSREASLTKSQIPTPLLLVVMARGSARRSIQSPQCHATRDPLASVWVFAGGISKPAPHVYLECHTCIQPPSQTLVTYDRHSSVTATGTSHSPHLTTTTC